ncbi:hypothetical protein ACIQJT_23945 [Streptomyces sp. NPDC091972]|uniref:hypothetical protein n=1 Tax=Streptomyces sp. NPDC091972 TaxID=3366007 RepID=UPI00381B43CB
MNHSSRSGAPQFPPRTSAPSEVVIEVPNQGLRRYDRVEAGECAVTVRQSGPGTEGEPLAYVHVPRDAPKGGRQARPPFTVSGPKAEPLCSIRSSGPGAYEVYGDDGAPIGWITRRGGRILPWPRRVRWSVRPVGGGPSVDGVVGTRKGWTVFLLISPLYFACWAVMAAQGAVWLLLGEKGEARKEAAWEMEPPTWTRWCAADEQDVVVEYRTGHVYRLAASRLDRRLAYAQAVLHVWDRA